MRRCATASSIRRGSAHSAARRRFRMDGVTLLCAQAQGMYWFLIMRAASQRRARRHRRREGTAQSARRRGEMGLRRLLIEAGIDLVRDEVTIQPVRARSEKGELRSDGRASGKPNGKIDGFWANGMGGRSHSAAAPAHWCSKSARRRPQKPGGFQLTPWPRSPRRCAHRAHARCCGCAVRAIVANSARSLRRQPRDEGRQRALPGSRSGVIADIVRRDLPINDAAIRPDFVAA